jgi:hypothetical protein
MMNTPGALSAAKKFGGYSILLGRPMLQQRSTPGCAKRQNFFGAEASAMGVRVCRLRYKVLSSKNSSGNDSIPAFDAYFIEPRLESLFH